jgi:hypothetical protein
MRIMALRKFVIEREIPSVGSFEREQLRAAAPEVERGADAAWARHPVGPKASSRPDMTYCIYLAKDEAIIRKHARGSAGFQPLASTEVRKMIDPTTAAA